MSIFTSERSYAAYAFNCGQAVWRDTSGHEKNSDELPESRDLPNGSSTAGLQGRASSAREHCWRREGEGGTKYAAGEAAMDEAAVVN